MTMLDYLKRWRSYFLFGSFFSFFINIIQLSFSIFIMLIFDKAMMSNSVPSLIAIALMGMVTLLAGILLDVVRNRLLVRLGIQMDLDLSERVFTTMMHAVASVPQGQAVAGMRDVAVLRQFCSGMAIFNFFDLPLVPICLLLVFALHPYLGVVALIGCLLSLVLGVLAERLTRSNLDQASALNGRAAALVGQASHNAEAVMSMGMLPGIITKWRGLNIAVMNLQTLASKRAGFLQALIRGLRMIMMLAMYTVGAYLVITGGGSSGILLGAGIAMGKAFGPIDAGMATYTQSLDAYACFRRLYALFSQPQPPERMNLPAPGGNLAVESLTFVAGGRPLLMDINFSLTAGQTMGLIGPSAAGKSTLCRLLVGLWSPVRGAVRLDGVDIQSWSYDRRGTFLGYLPQDVELFSGSVAQNIARLGEVDPERVVAAAKMAGAHEMILQFPSGYDTEIGAAGAILSGGQRQRIGLARALYGQPSLLVLDEPSSNLDDEGERALAQAVEQMKQSGGTVIIVSHKPSTIAKVDMLMVLKGGQVVMFGPREAVFRNLVGGAGAQPKPQPGRIAGA